MIKFWFYISSTRSITSSDRNRPHHQVTHPTGPVTLLSMQLTPCFAWSEPQSRVLLIYLVDSAHCNINTHLLAVSVITWSYVKLKCCHTLGFIYPVELSMSCFSALVYWLINRTCPGEACLLWLLLLFLDPVASSKSIKTCNMAWSLHSYEVNFFILF